LTIREVTLPISLKAELGGIAKDPWGNLKAGFTVNGVINRKDFGLTWNAVTESGGLLVSEDVRLAAEIQYVKS
jgi:polyisoprenoid-binding protein YceI